MIDPVAARHTAISKDTHRIMHIENATDEVKMLPKHKKNPEIGKKSVVYGKDVMLEKEDADGIKEGEIVTLMDWGNVSTTIALSSPVHVLGVFSFPLR